MAVQVTFAPACSVNTQAIHGRKAIVYNDLHQQRYKLQCSTTSDNVIFLQKAES